MTKQELQTLDTLLDKLFEERKAMVIENYFDGNEDDFEEIWTDDPYEVDDGQLLGLMWASDTVKDMLK